MALMHGALFEALTTANVPPDKAKAAAEEAAGYESRFGGLEANMKLLKWMVGVNLALTASVMALLGRMLMSWPTP